MKTPAGNYQQALVVDVGLRHGMCRIKWLLLH